MGPEPLRSYARATMGWLGGAGREDGQILPGLVMLLLAILALAVLGFQIGKAAILRSQAQTAADAAALAGAREIKRQLELQWATFGTTDITAIDEPLVRARMAEYADRNGGRLDPDHPPEINGVDVRVWVDTEEELGKGAERVGSEHDRGGARARATLSLGASLVGATDGLMPPPAGGGGTPRISDDEWDAIGKDIGKPPLSCPEDVITLGLLLKAHGFFVWQNNDPRLGGDAGHSYNPSSWHLKCGGMGAIDVNFDTGNEGAALDAIRGPVEQLGFNVIWRSTGHFDHMHIDPSPSAPGGTGGFTGPLEDVLLSVRLIDWDKEIAPLALFGQYGTESTYGGPPDLKIVALICQMAEPYGDKIQLAAFEAAIVESGIHNLNFGDADSHGVFQQQWSVGEWGTLEQTLDPVHATQMFLKTAAEMDRPGLPAGELAARVQRPREDLRGRYAAVEGQAMSLIGEYC
jgi:Putative Flp pilus-assembly TadE/G-like